MKNVIAIIKNAWGDSPPPKVKTGFILNIIGLTAFLCLSGATAHAQSDKQIINMDNPDYHIDVERFCSPFIDFDNPEEYNSKEVNYRYVKYTQNMNVSFSERYPILIHYISMDSLVTKKATFCDTGFGKLNLITNAQGKLISMNCETKMDKTGFKELVKAVRQKYGKPALKKAETGKDELKKILINSMVSKGKNIPVYLWKQDDEYIGLFMESEDVVNFFRAKKEFEDLLIIVYGPYIEDWNGKYITLYAAKVRAFGDVVEALRIRPKAPSIKTYICADCRQPIQGAGSKSAEEIAALGKQQ